MKFANLKYSLLFVLASFTISCSQPDVEEEAKALGELFCKTKNLSESALKSEESREKLEQARKLKAQYDKEYRILEQKYSKNNSYFRTFKITLAESIQNCN